MALKASKAWGATLILLAAVVLGVLSLAATHYVLLPISCKLGVDWIIEFFVGLAYDINQAKVGPSVKVANTTLWDQVGILTLVTAVIQVPLDIAVKRMGVRTTTATVFRSIAWSLAATLFVARTLLLVFFLNMNATTKKMTICGT